MAIARLNMHDYSLRVDYFSSRQASGMRQGRVKYPHILGQMRGALLQKLQLLSRSIKAYSLQCRKQFAHVVKVVPTTASNLND